MDVSALRARTDAVARRIRLARALRAGASTSAAGAAGVALALAAERVGWIGEADLRVAMAAGLAGSALVALAAASRRLPRLLPATLIDRAHALDGRVTAALELSREQAPLAQLAVEDALARTDALSAGRAFPLRAPAGTRALLFALVAIAIAATLHRPAARVPAPPPPPRLAPLLVHPDDVALEQHALAEIEARTTPSAELRAAIDDTNDLLEALAEQRVERADALRQLSDLVERLERPRPSALTTREDVLAAIGDHLGRGDTTRPLAEALAARDAAAAEAALSEIAERARQGELTAAERRELAQALAEARAAAERAREERESDPESVESDAPDAHPEAAGEAEERLLEEQREEVERRRQEIQREQEAQDQLDRLERELGDAADQLEGSEGDSERAADDLDDAVEELNRMARDQASEEEMQQLAEQLRQLREMIRRQRQQQGGQGEDGEGGSGSGRGSESGREGRMDRFVLRAGGGSESGSGGARLAIRGGAGGGEGGESEGQQGDPSESPSGSPGGASGSGAASEGEGGEGEGESQGGAGGSGAGEGGESEEQVLVLGDQSGGGAQAILELPGMGRSGSGTQRGSGDGDGDEPGGGAGTDHSPATLDDPTDRSGDHRTVAVQGEDRGRGPSRSEVIRGGAARGFASRDYERVYADYEAHAERAIEESEIPPGYRFYVRRYFDLIRPRD
ncbi:MAG: hypothetical protein U0234_04580 [Sandaracinus sp.]